MRNKKEKTMRFATETEIEIATLLDGEPVESMLPNLDGTESPSEILKRLTDLIAKALAEEVRGHRLHPNLV